MGCWAGVGSTCSFQWASIVPENCQAQSPGTAGWVAESLGPAISVKGTMKHLSRVVWNEGMYLAQHHFQVQSRYFEDSLRFALAHLFFKSYGVAGCRAGPRRPAERDRCVDPRAGSVAGRPSLSHARQRPPAASAGNSRALFSPTQESQQVHLVIPAYRQGGANCAPSAGQADSARYLPETVLVQG